MNLTYSSLTLSDAERVSLLVQAFYTEDPSLKPIKRESISATFHTFLTQPNRGKILVIRDDTAIIGYAILVYVWSNEFGGDILTLDELYISPDKRSLGIGTKVIEHLCSTEKGHCVAVQLEVNPENVLAKKLYQKLGFKKYHNETLLLEL
jgi:ribosomal protein S18 acetylase RimI-like enzyme